MASTPRDNAALVRAFLGDVVAGGDTDAIGVFLADDAVHHGPERAGRPGPRPWWRILAAAEVDIAIDDVVATGDRVAIRGTVNGTHTESLLDLAPSGATFEIDGVWFCRIEDGRIAEIWSLLDTLDLVDQLARTRDGALGRCRDGRSQDNHS